MVCEYTIQYNRIQNTSIERSFDIKSGSIMTNKLQINRAKSVAHTQIKRVETTEKKKIVNVVGLRRLEFE